MEMRQFRARLWAGVGVAALAAACQPPAKTESAAPPASAPAMASTMPMGESGEGGGDLVASMAPADAAAFRVALMRGHLAVAMKLVDESNGREAAAHFLHPVYEIYTPSKAEYDAKGLSLDVKKFEAASAAAAAGKPAREIRPMWEDLERQVEKLGPKNGQYSKPTVISALMKQLAAEYARGVQGGVVINAPEYQDSYGFTVVTRDLIKAAIKDGLAKDPSRSAELQREAEALVNMFPSASAPTKPAAPGEVLAQISRVELAFPGME
jgi:hypothetical protein